MSEHRSFHPGERHFGLDWLRIGAFLVLILYHVGMVFAPGDWLVKAGEPIEAVAWPMALVQPWRMPLLFVVSGFASRALLARSAGAVPFLGQRSQRLLLPLLFGIAFIVPPESWVGMIENRGYREGFIHFWSIDWFGFGASALAIPSRTEHLWFLAYLWTYTMLLGGALLVVPRRWRARTAGIVAALSRDRNLLWLPLLPLLSLRIVLLFTVPETHGLLHDWVSDFLYIPAFLFGFALAGTMQLWPAVLRVGRPALGLVLVCASILLAVEIAYPEGRSHLVQALHRDASLAMAWGTILVLLAFAHRWLNRDHPWRARLGEAVFPFYLVHQTIIVLAAWLLKDSVSALPLFLAVAAATGIGGALFCLMAFQSGPLRPFLGLSPRRALTKGSDALPEPA